jgi:hypothetical protein
MKGKIKLTRTALVTILNMLMVTTLILLNTSTALASNKSAFITSVSTNQSNYEGREVVMVTLTARNTGTGPVQLRGIVWIIDPKGKTILSQSARYDLAPRETDSNYFRWQIPEGAAKGNYRVQAVIRDGLNNTLYDSGLTNFYYRGQIR